MSECSERVAPTEKTEVGPSTSPLEIKQHVSDCIFFLRSVQYPRDNIHSSRGQNTGNAVGKDVGGFKGYLEGIFENPALTQIIGKNIV